LDLDGKAGDVVVSALGWEELVFQKEQGDWIPAEGWAPRLAAALGALEERRKALETGDSGKLQSLLRPQDRADAGEDPALQAVLRLRNRRYRVLRWSLRLERDEVLVTEEGRLTGDTPERPVDLLQKRRLRLVRGGVEFFFSPTLM
jgi:hypothetical protein